MTIKKNQFQPSCVGTYYSEFIVISSVLSVFLNLDGEPLLDFSYIITCPVHPGQWRQPFLDYKNLTNPLVKKF